MFNQDSRLRAIFIAAFFTLGITLVYFGWSIKGEMSGLVTMLFGVALLLTSIFVYNKPYK